MQLPNYWDAESGISYFTIGDGILSGTVVINNNLVQYLFCDGNRLWVRERTFSRPQKAMEFALKWERYMRNCKLRGTVPLPVTFDEF